MKKLITALGIILLFVGIIFLIKSQIKPHHSSVLSANKKSDYTLVFLGDSMTEYLGNFDELRNYLKDYYPGKNFLLLNYGYSSTNILSAQERIEKETSHSGRIFQPINQIPFDLILIESFGHNPLSGYPLEEGLKKQTEALDKIVSTLTQKHPRNKIIFVATISPNKDQYGEKVLNLSHEMRQKWAEERIAYIKNHINYAKTHGIPVIDIFDDSLDSEGNGKLEYISSNDFIHPSPTGVYFISKEIAKFLFDNQYFRR